MKKAIEVDHRCEQRSWDNVPRYSGSIPGPGPPRSFLVLCAEIYPELARVLSGKIRAKKSIDETTGPRPPAIDEPGSPGRGCGAIDFAPLTMGAMGSRRRWVRSNSFVFFFPLFFFLYSSLSLQFYTRSLIKILCTYLFFTSMYL